MLNEWFYLLWYNLRLVCCVNGSWMDIDGIWVYLVMFGSAIVGTWWPTKSLVQYLDPLREDQWMWNSFDIIVMIQLDMYMFYLAIWCSYNAFWNSASSPFDYPGKLSQNVKFYRFLSTTQLVSRLGSRPASPLEVTICKLKS